MNYLILFSFIFDVRQSAPYRDRMHIKIIPFDFVFINTLKMLKQE